MLSSNAAVSPLTKVLSQQQDVIGTNFYGISNIVLPCYLTLARD